MLELTMNRKSEDLIEMFLSARPVEAGAEGSACEHFAYRKTLLFYADECKYCRYAKMIRTKDGNDCVCAYAAQHLQDSAS